MSSASTCNCAVSSTSGATLANLCGGSSFMVFMGLLEVFMRTQCDIEDPCGRVQYKTTAETRTDYDFIIVGGGSAGAVVASRLSEVSQWKILLIEAGGDEPTGSQVPSMFLNYIGSDIDWKYLTEPESFACLNSKEQRCYWPRGKVLGGTSVMNGMMYIRGNKKDYDNWANMGNPGWSYNEVLPFFLKSENNLQLKDLDPKYHAEGGPLPVSQFSYHPALSYAIIRGGEELGYTNQDLNGANATGFMIAQMTQRNGIRMSTARAFLRPQKDNLHVLLNTTVSKVLINPETKTVHGVQVLDKYGSSHIYLVNKEVILSGGAVNSPQILMLSGVGPKEELERAGVQTIHDLSGVGKNLHNHVAYFTKFYINEMDINPLNWATAVEFLLFRDGLMSGTGLSAVTAKIRSKYAEHPDDPDIQLYFGGYLAGCSKSGQIDEMLSDKKRSISIFPAVLYPKSRGYITIGSNDPLEPPKIYANYFSDKRDVKTLIDGIRFAIKLANTEELRAFGISLDATPEKGCENLVFNTDEYWECAVRRNTMPENHQAGSCKMGNKTDKYAVVDHELRVHGIRGLRVIDASIMPKVTAGNTNAPVIMIAEKGAHHIRRAYGAA